MGTEARSTLQQLSFGAEIAEQEKEALSKYFVQTEFWRRILEGNADIVFGSKGAGKSAIYLLIQDHKDELGKRDIITTNAENPSGATAFKQLVNDPPTSEAEFRNLWKTYFCVLAIRALRGLKPLSKKAATVQAALKQSGLLPDDKATLQSVVTSVMRYVRRFTEPSAAEMEIKYDAAGNVAGLVPKLVFGEPSLEQRREGAISTDEALAMLSDALEAKGKKLWILLDRLDVAFDQSEELETNALRALFRVYSDMQAHQSFALKIFLRDDIWSRITAEGFREASHISKQATLKWAKAALLNLIVRRALTNECVVERYGVDPTATLASSEEQEALFYRMFPEKVEAEPRRESRRHPGLSHAAIALGSCAA